MMRNFKLLIAVFMACFFIGTAVAAPDGYLADTDGNIVRNGSGECWHTGYWTPAMAVPECGAATNPSSGTGVSTVALPAGQLAALEHSASPQWTVELDVKPDTVAVGNLSITVAIRSARSGYLTILQRGTDGTEEVVFPNALDKDNRIEAGKPLILPRENWIWRAAPPAGEGRLLAIVSERPADLRSVQASLGGQTYGAASATYRELNP